MSIVDKYWQLRYDLLRNRWLAKRKPSQSEAVVLMYHHVTDNCTDEYGDCGISKDSFKQAITDLKSQGYIFVSLDACLSLIGKESNQRFAVLTFDDVPADFLENAYPFLRSKEIPFTLFITTSYLQTVGFLNEEQIKELVKDPLCTIGAHSVTHPMLRNSKDYKEEISNSKKILEETLDKPIDYFAYPYGRQSAVSRRVRKCVKEYGYKAAFSTIFAPISSVTLRKRYFLPRVAYMGGPVEDYFELHIPFQNKINSLKRLFGK